LNGHYRTTAEIVFSDTTDYGVTFRRLLDLREAAVLPFTRMFDNDGMFGTIETSAERALSLNG